ncbi:uncharacterized protein LOC122755230 [Dromiciops gliroides]|uniref:uncharacterized protein LOC122755230 n=1 Tax=Dromiciops gliroides TaxID=33562 RepID=UPI001CC70D7D|nr:uncharacterized protein LOC122755230 [Dromiciops gliroides]
MLIRVQGRKSGICPHRQEDRSDLASPSMKRPNRAACCCCCRASRRVHYAPYSPGDAAQAAAPASHPLREREREVRAHDWSWAAAAEEEEEAAVALAAAAPRKRDYFLEDDGEMVPKTSHVAAFLSETKERGPPMQSHPWRSFEKASFGQTHSLRAFEKAPLGQTQALRDFEKHLNDLKKENFSLKLRIYFLEERMQQKYEASQEDVYKRRNGDNQIASRSGTSCGVARALANGRGISCSQSLSWQAP